LAPEIVTVVSPAMTVAGDSVSCGDFEAVGHGLIGDGEGDDGLDDGDPLGREDGVLVGLALGDPPPVVPGDPPGEALGLASATPADVTVSD
jgi:hypothetical protein